MFCNYQLVIVGVVLLCIGYLVIYGSSSTSIQETFVGEAVASSSCAAKCKAAGYCCNNIMEGSNQYLSCAQGCYMAEAEAADSGTLDVNTCKSKCSAQGASRGCSYQDGDVHFPALCGVCSDFVPNAPGSNASNNPKCAFSGAGTGASCAAGCELAAGSTSCGPNQPRQYKMVAHNQSCNWARSARGSQGSAIIEHGSLQDVQKLCDQTPGCDYVDYVYTQWEKDNFGYGDLWGAGKCPSSGWGKNTARNIYQAVKNPPCPNPPPPPTCSTFLGSNNCPSGTTSKSANAACSGSGTSYIPNTGDVVNIAYYNEDYPNIGPDAWLGIGGRDDKKNNNIMLMADPDVDANGTGGAWRLVQDPSQPEGPERGFYLQNLVGCNGGARCGMMAGFKGGNVELPSEMPISFADGYNGMSWKLGGPQQMANGDTNIFTIENILFNIPGGRGEHYMGVVGGNQHNTGLNPIGNNVTLLPNSNNGSVYWRIIPVGAGGGGGCSASTCCTPNPQCSSLEGCPEKTTMTSPSKVCAGPVCSTGECCPDNPVCASSICNAQTQIFTGAGVRCNEATCNAGECCAERAQCNTITCDSSKYDSKPANTYCAGTTCSVSECCIPDPTCAGYNCPVGTYHPKQNQAGIKCGVNQSCTTDECCDLNPTCAGFSPCPTHEHLKNTAPNIRCKTATCNSTECCGWNPKCSTHTCLEDDFYWSYSHIPNASGVFCNTEVCTDNQCCVATPTGNLPKVQTYPIFTQ